MYFQGYSDLVQICVVKKCSVKNMPLKHFYLYGLGYDWWLLCFEVAQLFLFLLRQGVEFAAVVYLFLQMHFCSCRRGRSRTQRTWTSWTKRPSTSYNRSRSNLSRAILAKSVVKIHRPIDSTVVVQSKPQSSITPLRVIDRQAGIDPVTLTASFGESVVTGL